MKVRDTVGLDFLGGGTGGIGTPDELRDHLRAFADCGVDQTVFIQQGGNNRHEHICEALEMFAERVMPEFKAAEAERLAAKEAELAPYVEKAFARKEYLAAMADDEIPTYRAYGITVAEEEMASMPEVRRKRIEQMRKLADLVRDVDAAEAEVGDVPVAD